MECTDGKPSGFKKKRMLLYTALLMVIVLLCLGIYQWQQKDVFIDVDNRHLAVKTFRDNVGQLLEEQKIELAAEDAVNLDLDEVLRDGMEIKIIRAIEVSLQVGAEKPRQVTALPGTVAEILGKAGIEPGPDDLVEPGLDSKITSPQKIAVTRVAKKIVAEEREIPFQTERRTDSHLERGLRKTLAAGGNGLEQISWEVTYQNGQEVSRTEVTRKVIKEPQNKVIAEGSLQIASRGSDNIRFDRVVVAEASAYTHSGNLTYTDTKPKKGTIAVDPKVIPLGAKVYIEGYGYGKAEDIGSEIKGKKVDLFFETLQDALKWGRRNVKVYILR